MFLIILLVIILLSIGLSLWSLKNLSAKREVEEVRGKLKKDRVVFQSSGSSSSK